jgi:hypothetical protein
LLFERREIRKDVGNGVKVERKRCLFEEGRKGTMVVCKRERE